MSHHTGSDHMCECAGSGIKNVLCGGDIVQDFCECEAGELLQKRAEGADLEDGLVPPFSPFDASRALYWFNA